jgi:hypothetical protein
MATGGVKWPMRNDPFRTLDDPEPAGIPAGPIEPAITAGTVTSWRMPAERPGWLRRLIVWLLLGWKWG